MARMDGKRKWMKLKNILFENDEREREREIEREKSNR